MKRLLSTSFLTLLVLVASLNITAAQASVIKPGSKLRVFFIQTARAAKIMPIPNKPNQYKLTLKRVDPYLSFIADRPKRVSGLITIKDLFNIWNYGPNNFNNTHPNVAVETTLKKIAGHHVAKVKKMSIMGTLSNPQYNHKKDSMTYTFTLLNKNQMFTNKVKLGYTVIFIDSAMIHWNPGGFGA